MSAEPRPPVPPPKAPRPGMHLLVQFPDEHWSMWPEWRVDRVNSRSFYVRNRGVRERRLIVEWQSWLRSLAQDGTLCLDGEPVRLGHVGLPSPANDLPDERRHEHDPVDASALLRRGRTLARRCSLHRTDSERPRQAAVRPEGPRPGWRVLLSTDWSAGPLCSCRDDVEPRPGRPCEHAVAACLVYEDLRCQLLDLLMAG
jgi:hypothetical protein